MKCRVLAKLSFPHASYLVQDIRMADIRLASLVYVSTYCVPIAHLRQNKQFPLLYLGHAQIIKTKREARGKPKKNQTKNLHRLLRTNCC